MKKSTFLLTGIVSLAFSVNAQTIVNTGAGNKHAVIEEFTGIKCSNCPSGHTTVNNITSSNPNTVHVVAYGPTNSSYTNPTGTNGADFRRSFADAFYTASYCSPGNGSRFMPSAFVNRKLSGGNILQSTSAWTGMTNTTLTESSPINVGVKSTYNSTAQTLTIDVEVYYTSTVSTNNNLYVLITEDNLTSGYQSGTSASTSNPYVYKHTFRENVTSPQWGDVLSGSKMTGSVITKQYVFNLSGAIDPINIANANVLAFVTNDDVSNKEIYTGISTEADGGLASTGTGAVGIEEVEKSIAVNVYPNPSQGNVNINVNGANATHLEIFNVLGESVYTQSLTNKTNKVISLNETTFKSKGVYFVKVKGSETSVTERLIIN